ncbi:MAG: FAD-binding and (Fe-S)-binding domain-containing protein [Myxococcales bacterium]
MRLRTATREEARPARPRREVDARALEAELRRRVRGEVRFDRGSRALYATDGSNYRQVPIGVVVPRTAQDVVEAVAAAREASAPITMRGGGTSLAGQCCNVAVVIDCSKYLDRILEIDVERRRARVQAGVVLDVLRKEAEKHHLTFAPDPSTHDHCTLGGMIGNNSCGVHSVMGGSTSDNVEALEVVLYDGTRLTVGATPESELERIVAGGGRRGEIYRRLRDLRDRYSARIRARFPDIPRRVSGFDLTQLLPEKGFHLARALVGTEGTCAIVLEATVRLVPSPPCRSLLVLGYEDVYRAGDHIPEVIEAGPIGCEGIDDVLVADMKRMHIHPQDTQLLPEGKGWLLVEFGGESKAESDAKARALMSRLSGGPSMKLFDDRSQEAKLWRVREAGLGATARLADGTETWEGWEDAAVPAREVGKYLREFRKLLDDYGYQCALYGHFGQGCVHTRIEFDLKTRGGIANYRRFVTDAARLVVSHGGSLSGEHGDGQSKAELLPLMYGDELVRAFEEFKSIWDPDWRMNPGKVVRPYRIDENLRLGTGYRPPEPRTRFAFPEDQFSFAKATRRCVGIGECRKHEGGAMCPSYRATKEEMHSTRGRAHLLFEMLQGDPLRGGWRDEAVKEALDLCLACKACKGECPVNVDMATYKAEFLSHYYEGRARPRHAYAMGLIHWWARIASRVPRLANFAGHAPLLSRALKWMAGIAPERNVPRFATQSFRSWFEARPQVNPGRQRVLLWADTFNNFFHPEVAQAAVAVLEDAGFQVDIQPERLCCGRPLYDYGMLDLAKRKLRQILDELRPALARGTPVVGLEPSCVATFRDELRGLFPHDEDAKRLREQTYLLSEFLVEHAKEWAPPRLHRKAIVHGHCHHESVLGFDDEKKLLERVGIDAEVLDSGCCGMAGSFGFEREKFAISMRIGEQKLLPRARACPPGTLLVADGFSCREQIEQGAGKVPLHIAQVLQIASGRSERAPRARSPVAGRRAFAVVAIAGAAVVAALLVRAA